MFRPVVAWIDLTDMTRGTALVNWVLARPWRRWPLRALLWIKGHPFSVVESLARDDAGPLAGPIRVPAHMRVIHVFGVPCRRHLSSRFARWSRRLAPLSCRPSASWRRTARARTAASPARITSA